MLTFFKNLHTQELKTHRVNNQPRSYFLCHKIIFRVFDSEKDYSYKNFVTFPPIFYCESATDTVLQMLSRGFYCMDLLVKY